VEKQQLRHDLFYRLNVLSFELSPLRERQEDILFLSEQFITFFNGVLKKQVCGLDEEIQRIFIHYKWPGNVRELKHTIEYMMNVCEEEQLTGKDLPILLKQAGPPKGKMSTPLSLKSHLQKLENDLISQALSLSKGNIMQAASLLDIPRQTLQYKLKKNRAE
jgi:arginine utilization regulatory protein